MDNGYRNAYPLSGSQYVEQNGLTKRELFAGMAMQGLLGNETEKAYFDSAATVANHAVRYADALLLALEDD